MTKTHMHLTLAMAGLLAAHLGWAQNTQGVTQDTIVLGSIQDLSGPLASFGKQLRNGMQMRAEEINAKGGINGRKIELLIEDSGYDPKRAVLAAQKLVNRDKVFAMVGNIGTAPTVAAFPIQFAKNVISWYPITAAREMYEPLHRLKYSYAATYYDQMRLSGPVMVKEKGAKRPCIIYQDDEFGLEVLRGAEDGLKGMGMSLAEKTSFKRGATDFSSQVARMKAAQCDFVFLGTIIRETIGTVAEARKTGFNPVFFASNAAYTDIIHKIGGPAMNGIYATNTVQNPYVDDETAPALREWANRYKERFKEDAAVFSVYGYLLIDQFAQVASKAGRSLNTDSFIAVADQSTLVDEVFGLAPMRFTPTQRLGNNQSHISQIVDGRWRLIKASSDK